MTLIKASMLTLLMAPAGFLVCGPASAQQASFAVSVTVHSVMKPLSAAQLCSQSKPISMLGATIAVDCPVVASAHSNSADAKGSVTPSKLSPPEVTVTF